MPVNRSESFVCDLCDRSFLVPWAYVNTVVGEGRELIDVIVVFGHRVILLSVKEYSPKHLDLPEIAKDRWTRKALLASIKQLKGARRRIETATTFLEPSSRRIVNLPPLHQRRTHLVSVSLGGLQFGRFGSQRTPDGFIHVLDDGALVPHFMQLNTIDEFLSYLEYREHALEPLGAPPPEEDWLGSYLLNLRYHASAMPSIGSFTQYWEAPAAKEARQTDPPSFFWDQTIIHLWSERKGFMSTGGKIGKRNIPPPSAEMMDTILRQLAIHPRTERRFLGSSLLAFFFKEPRRRARVFRAQTGPGYVVQQFDSHEALEDVQGELLARCIYAQECWMPDRNVVGLATNRDFVHFSPEARLFLCYLEGSVNSEAMRQSAQTLGKDLGLFQEIRIYDVPLHPFGIRPVND